jgi:tRNA and rRNA cytosine-C5-methylases
VSNRKEKEEAEKKKRAEAFDSTYREIYGDRWDSLKASLLEETCPVEFSTGLKAPYFMDEASILVASVLPLNGNEAVLDMCAAPGGKTLVLSSRLTTGTILANDRSRDRKLRLDKVLDDCLPGNKRECVSTINRNAALFGKEYPDSFDAVLLDAPCSSERHVINSEKHLSIWSASRPKRLAIEQFALLCAALDAVKMGGYILYSTCALIPAEDELVIKKLLERREGKVEAVPFSLKYSEDREYGKIVLPDTAGGKGPLYACLLKRIG